MLLELIRIGVLTVSFVTLSVLWAVVCAYMLGNAFDLEDTEIDPEGLFFGGTLSDAEQDELARLTNVRT